MGEQEFKNVARPVEVFALRGIAAEPAMVARHSGRSRLRRVLALGCAVVAVLALALWATWPTPLAFVLDQAGLQPGTERPAVIAVLPFAHMSADPSQEHISDGLAIDIVGRLESLRVFPVIAPNSTFSYKGKAITVTEVSMQLGADYVVEGTVHPGYQSSPRNPWDSGALDWATRRPRARTAACTSGALPQKRETESPIPRLPLPRVRGSGPKWWGFRVRE